MFPHRGLSQAPDRATNALLASLLLVLLLVGQLPAVAKSSTVPCSHSASHLIDTQKLLAENPHLTSKPDEVVRPEESASGHSIKNERHEDQSASAKPLLAKVISKPISKEALAKIAAVSVTVDEHGKPVKYSGAPLRALLKEEVAAIDDMPAWKILARQKIMLEVLGKDGFPALMSAVEVSTNQAGDRFVLATEADGKPLDEVRLICPNDQHRTRWVRDCTSLKIFNVEQ